MFAPNSNLNDQILKAYIEKVFDQYDTDKSGTLDEKEITLFFNNLFQALNIPQSVNQQQSKQAIKSMDTDNNGVIDKQELFAAFKALLNNMKQKQMQKQMNNQYPYYPPNMYPGYGGYGPYPCMANNFYGSVPNPYMYGQPFNPQMGQFTPPYNMYGPMPNQYQNQSMQGSSNMYNPKGGNLSNSQYAKGKGKGSNNPENDQSFKMKSNSSYGGSWGKRQA